MSHNETSRITVVTPPTLFPVTLAQARRQIILASDDTSRDDELNDLIAAAVEQWESDTDSCLMARTLRVYLESLSGDEIYLPSRPVASITSILYFDDGNTQQTLSTSVYDLDQGERSVNLKFNQVWPSLSTRWDAVQVNYVAGVSSLADVPAIAKRAVMLLIGYYFAKNRGDNDGANDMRAYERLVQHHLRSTYP